MQPNKQLKLKLKECADLLSKIAEEGVTRAEAEAELATRKVINLSAMRSLYENK